MGTQTVKLAFPYLISRLNARATWGGGLKNVDPMIPLSTITMSPPVPRRLSLTCQKRPVKESGVDPLSASGGPIYFFLRLFA